MATHKVTLELTDDELDMLASLFNTVTICEMNGDEPLHLTDHLSPPINKFCDWAKLCSHLATEFNFKGGKHKYVTSIAKALAVRSKYKGI